MMRVNRIGVDEETSYGIERHLSQLCVSSHLARLTICTDAQAAYHVLYGQSVVLSSIRHCLHNLRSLHFSSGFQLNDSAVITVLVCDHIQQSLQRLAIETCASVTNAIAPYLLQLCACSSLDLIDTRFDYHGLAVLAGYPMLIMLINVPEYEQAPHTIVPRIGSWTVLPESMLPATVGWSAQLRHQGFVPAEYY